MSAYTDLTGHQVDQYFLLRQIEQQATTNSAQTTANTANEEV